MKRGLLAATFTLPLLPLSWLVSSAITVSTALQVERRASWVVVSAVGVLLGVGVCGLAAREIWLLIRDHARARSTGRKQGSATAAATPYTAE